MRNPNPNLTLPQVLQRSVDRFPKKTFIQFEGEKVSFFDFNRRTNALANYLKHQYQIQKGDRVCLFAQNSLEFPIAFFAILKLGAIVIPVNSFLKSDEVAYILENSEAALLLYSSAFKKIVEGVAAHTQTDIPFVLLEGIQEELTKMPKQFVSVSVESDALAVFIYTSGTTGHPKGAMLTHKNFIFNIEGALQVIDINHKDAFLVFLPLFHSFTLTVLFLLPLFAGAKILLLPTVVKPKKILKALFWDGATLLAGIPHVYQLLSRRKVPFLMRLLLRLRYGISGAAPLPEAVLRRFEKNWKIPLLEGYGLSEASPVVSINPPKGIRKPLSVGIPLPNVEVKIVNARGKTLGQEEEGEICVKGPNVMKGYFNNETETKKVLKNGWLKTGDLGKVDRDGYLYILDRKKDLILVRGINVYPREVEELLNKNPKIKECAVVGEADAKKGETPVAHIVLKENEALTAKEIKHWCREHLANYKVPSQFIFHTSLPKTATGKILKRKLKSV